MIERLICLPPFDALTIPEFPQKTTTKNVHHQGMVNKVNNLLPIFGEKEEEEDRLLWSLLSPRG